ncbi:MAG: hypothetical protein WC371_02775 [Parachlamydiales bacterium]|jgi:DNA-directed RNA polymerase beta' subunit
MSISKEYQNKIIKVLLEEIAEISNKEHQKKIWVPQGPDFDEIINCLADIIEPILEKHKKYQLSEDRYELLVKFYKEFKNFSDYAKKNDYNYYYLYGFLDTPEWAKVMDTAKEVLQAFNYKSED